MSLAWIPVDYIVPKTGCSQGVDMGARIYLSPPHLPNFLDVVRAHFILCIGDPWMCIVLYLSLTNLSHTASSV